ncbi:variable large family protein [Borreliella lusitaniae]|uniref:variable large family protein n=1 Tax=Borreliella lusitaniae TaxID=100177 RepID=UPI003AB7941A
MFATANNNGANAAQAGGAADAVSKVSGQQILKAIVDSADGAGNAPADATSPIDAAIGGAAVAGVKSTVEELIGLISGEMAAAAAKGAKAATGGAAEAIGNVAVAAEAAAGGAQGNSANVKGIAEGMKGIVGAAAKMGVELKAAAAAAAGAGNAVAGHLFATAVGAANGATAAQAGNAADAVSKVSGQQILKAIVESADGEGQRPAAATSPIDAAIGAAADNGDAGDFANQMLQNDKIAAAIVLRGMAAGGKFAVTAAADADGVKSTVNRLNAWITEMAAAAAKGATAATGAADEAIGNVAVAAAANAGARGDAASVKGIAAGMKGIVEAAEKMGVELKVGAVAQADANAANVGNLFASGGAAAGTAVHAGAAADAVSKVSGQQILKAIVESADGAGAAPNAATSPIDAAIGAAAGQGANFAAGMLHNDKIAAAIVLRGMAAGGKFALAQGQDAAAVAGLKSTVEELSAWISKMAAAAAKGAEAATGSAAEAIGNVAVADGGNNAGARGDAANVKGIAEGMKGIVEAAEKMGVELKVGAVAGAAGNANTVGHLFASGGNAADANAAAAGAAAEVVSKVSGQQILKAIIESADGNGQVPGQANGPIDAAIGANAGDGAAFGEAGMTGNDKIAAAIVLRGMAKDGKFALAAGEAAAVNGVKSTVEKLNALITEMATAAAKGATAATGAAEDAIGNVAAAADAQNAGGARGDAASVKGIAAGMKGIVEAAAKMGVELKVGAVAQAVNNANTVGNLFASGGAAANADAAAAGNAAEVVSKVSGQQIIKAIVESADGAGAAPNAATSPIDAAIGGAAGAGAAFGQGMTGNDKIAAAIVLRGMAAGGKFALANNAGAAVVAGVKSTVEKLSGWRTEMAAAAAKGAEAATGTADEAIGNVAAAAGGNNAGARGDAASVKGMLRV